MISSGKMAELWLGLSRLVADKSRSDFTLGSGQSGRQVDWANRDGVGKVMARA